MIENINKIEELNKIFADKTAEEILFYMDSHYPRKIALASSMGAEDQVLTHMIRKINKNIRIFTLDTGRLFPETYDLIQKTRKKYGMTIEVFFPEKEAVEKMVNSKGINLFYESIENRKLCCNIRKKEPIKRALKGLDAWICGLRKDQSLDRFSSNIVEWDELNGLIKINPLLYWRNKDVWEYIKAHDIPYNSLHDEGFPSIGCQPCTRAINDSEEFRAGRWWWEEKEKKECGLHQTGIK
ncbi:MAG: phosphoadenylyl-sulfate reductase [Bacteroidales bacterium]|nr:phosphoadenylyl-sulfate reductase [Bacteroidales bacterium]